MIHRTTALTFTGLLRAVARLGLGRFFALCALLQGLLLSVAIRRPGPAALPTCC